MVSTGPRKRTRKSSTNAGVGKTTKRTITKQTATKTTTASSSKTPAASSSKPAAAFTPKPAAAAATTKSGNKKSSTMTTPAREIAITKSSLRKKLTTSTTTSSVAESSDSEPDDPAARRLAAFHKERGLTFEELHVQSDNKNSNISDSPETSKTPQKNPKKTTKASSKTPATTAETKAVKPASRKRSREADIDETPEKSSPPSPKKKLTLKVSPREKITLKLGKKSSPVNAEPADNEATVTAPPAKRLKANPPAPALAPAVPAIPVATATRTGKTKVKGAPVITKNGHVKKTPEYAVEHAFHGTPSNKGSSLERPQFASLDKPWSCANLNCSTGMTWVPRDHKDPATGKGPMGRKVISQFFGRNKGPTKLIPNDVWHYFCRKDYQRSRYAAEHGTPTELANQVVTNLRDQLIRLELWRPQALFKVQLDKGASDRLNKYYALLRQHNNDEDAANAALPTPKDPKKVKPEEAFPCAASENFNRLFATPGATATYDDIEEIIAWSEAGVASGQSTVFVPCEFLVNPIQDNETVQDISDNFAQWMEVSAEINKGSTAASPAPGPSKSSKLPAIPNNDPEETEAADDSELDEPMTPTPAPRTIRADPLDQMSMMRDLNDAAVQMNYHARSDRSASS